MFRPRLQLLVGLSLLSISMLAPTHCLAQGSVPPPAPPGNVVAADNPNDSGNTMLVTWDASPDAERAGAVTGYRVLRSDNGGAMTEVATELGITTTVPEDEATVTIVPSSSTV